MSEKQELKEYRQGNTVRLTVEVRDKHGIDTVHADAFLEGSTEDDLDADLRLSGWPEGHPTQAVVELQEGVEQHRPGIYVCENIITSNPYDAVRHHDLDPPLRLRIVEHPDDVREGPEVVSVGEFY